MEISIIDSIALSVQSHLKLGTVAYIIYSDKSIGDTAPVSGSGTHGENNNVIKRGLNKWNELTNSDSSAVGKTQETLKNVDAKVKENLLAVMQ